MAYQSADCTVARLHCFHILRILHFCKIIWQSDYIAGTLCHSRIIARQPTVNTPEWLVLNKLNAGHAISPLPMLQSRPAQWKHSSCVHKLYAWELQGQVLQF